MDDDEDLASRFCEEDIDVILQRRTQVVKIEAGVKGSTFAKVCVCGIVKCKAFQSY